MVKATLTFSLFMQGRIRSQRNRLYQLQRSLIHGHGHGPDHFRHDSCVGEKIEYKDTLDIDSLCVDS